MVPDHLVIARGVCSFVCSGSIDTALPDLCSAEAHARPVNGALEEDTPFYE